MCLTYKVPTHPLSPTSLSSPDQPLTNTFSHAIPCINTSLPEQQAKEADGKSFVSSTTTLLRVGARDPLDPQPMARRTLNSEICTQVCHCTMTLCKPGFQQDFRPRKIQSPQAMYQKDERSYPHPQHIQKHVADSATSS